METQTDQIILTPDSVILLSRENAKTFHEKKKELIKETGSGIFEYLELLQFFSKLKEVISGNNQSNIPPDKEFVSMVRDEIAKYPQGKYTTAKGVKFENAEVGTKYDFSQCGDPVLRELLNKSFEIKTKVDERQAFLKAVPISGMDIITDDGEAVRIYPPSKTSTSSYKITLAK